MKNVLSRLPGILESFLLFFLVLVSTFTFTLPQVYAQSSRGDLVVDAVTVDAERNLKVSIKNAGTAPITVGANVDVIFVYKDPAGKVIHTYTTTAPNGTLAPGAGVFMPYVLLENGATTWYGAASLTVTVKGGNGFVEANTNNNAKTITLPLPDIAVDTLTVNAQRDLKVSVKNVGGTSLGLGSNVELSMVYKSVTGEEVHRYTPRLPAVTLKAGQVYEIPYSLLENGEVRYGAASLTVTITVLRNIVETNTRNNTKTITLPLPDMIVDTVTVNAERDVKVWVKNAGGSEVGLGSNYQVAMTYKNGAGEVVHEYTFQPPTTVLQAGQRLEIPMFSHENGEVRYGAASLTVSLNPVRNYAESNKDNNSKTITLPQPDMVVDTLTVNAQRDLTVSVKNIGSSEVGLGSNYQVAMTYKNAAGGVVHEYSFQPPTTVLKAGQGIAMPYNSLQNGEVRYGAASLTVTVKEIRNFAESNTNNNSKTITLPLPDMVVDTLTVDPQRNVKLSVKNIGGSEVGLGSNYQVAMMYKNGTGDIVEEYTFQPPTTVLQAGQGIAIPSNLIKGGKANERAASLTVSLKEIRNFAESNPNNNTKSVTFASVDLPDLVVDDLTLLPAGYLDYSIKNIGTGNATTPNLEITQVFKDASDTVIGTVKRPMPFFLSAGDTFTMVREVVHPSAVSVTVTINENKALSESSYSNNSKSTGFPKADLIISAIKKTGKDGLSAVIKNIGEVTYTGSLSIDSSLDDLPGQAAYNPIGRVTLDKEAELTVPVLSYTNPTTTSIHFELKTSPADGNTQNNGADFTVLIDLNLQDIIKRDEFTSSVSATKTAEDPGLLPDNPFYGVKELGRGIAEIITLDPEKKIELGDKIINEKALEINAMIDKNASSDKIIGAVESQFKKEGQVAVAIDTLRKKDPTKADTLTTKFVGDKIRQQTIIDKVKGKVSIDEALAVEKQHETSLDGLGNMVGKLKDPNKLKDALDTASSGKGSPFKPLKDLVAINDISTHIADGKAREILEEARVKKANHLKNNLQSLDSQQLNLFKDYIDKTTGDKVNTLKALDDIKVVVTDVNVKATIGSAKQSTATKLIKGIKEAKAKDPKASETLLSGLKKGTIKDLRVLSELKSDDPGVNTDILAIKKTAINNFEINVGKLPPIEKQKFLKNITKDNLDLTQQAVVNDIKKTLPKSKLGQELDSTLKEEIKSKVARVKQNRKEYDAFLSEISGSTYADKTIVNDFTYGFDSGFLKDIMRQQLAYMKSFYANADPETRKFFDQYYFNDPQIKEFYSNFDSAFDKMFSNISPEDFDQAYEPEDESFEQSEDAYDENTDYDAQTTSGCAMIDEPVCGTDGLNYANECEAKDSGVDVAYTGECQEESSVSDDESQNESEDVQGAATYRLTWPAWWPFH